MIPTFSYIQVRSLEDAVRHLSSGEARILAGGTDLLGCIRDRVFGAGKIVSISKLKDLRGIRETADGGMRIGALTPVAEVAEHAVIRKRYAALALAAAQVGSPQLRNQGTMGGNLCQKPRCWYYRGEFHCLRKGGEKCYAVGGENHYHCILGGDRCYIVHPSDTAPALMALKASVRIAGGEGVRTVPMEDFYVPPGRDIRNETVVKPDEIVIETILPPAEGFRSSYRKVRERSSWDFALASVALALRFTGDKVAEARIALGGAAPVPWRCKEAEETITGKALDAVTVRHAAEVALGNARPLEHNGYKISLFRGLIEDGLLGIERA